METPQSLRALCERFLPDETERLTMFDFNPRNKSAEFGYVLLPNIAGKDI